MVTFLFTDVEGSTRRWEADADAMRTALAAHDEVLRNAIEGHGGFLFKHTGDGVCAAFSAITCDVEDAFYSADREVSSEAPFGDARGCGKIGCGRSPRSVLLGAAKPVSQFDPGSRLAVARFPWSLVTGRSLSPCETFTDAQIVHHHA
jgi:class 3 adenylate cyclase